MRQSVFAVSSIICARKLEHIHCICFNCNTIIRYCVILLRFFGNLCLWNIVCSPVFYSVLFFSFARHPLIVYRVSQRVSVFMSIVRLILRRITAVCFFTVSAALPTVKRFKLIFHSIDHSVLCSAIAQCDCNICTVIFCQHPVKKFQ